MQPFSPLQGVGKATAEDVAAAYPYLQLLFEASTDDVMKSVKGEYCGWVGCRLVPGPLPRPWDRRNAGKGGGGGGGGGAEEGCRGCCTPPALGPQCNALHGRVHTD